MDSAKSNHLSGPTLQYPHTGGEGFDERDFVGQGWVSAEACRVLLLSVSPLLSFFFIYLCLAVLVPAAAHRVFICGM